MINHHAGNPQRAPQAETEPAPRRTPFLLTDARRAKPHPIQLRAGTPHTPHHDATQRTGSCTNPHMPDASAASRRRVGDYCVAEERTHRTKDA